MGNIQGSTSSNVTLRRRNSLRKSVSEVSKRISTEIKLTIIGILLAIFSKKKNKELSFANPLDEEPNKKRTEEGFRNPLFGQELDQEKISEIQGEYKKIAEDFQKIAEKIVYGEDFSESFQKLFSESEAKSFTTDKDLIDFSSTTDKDLIDFSSTTDKDLINFSEPEVDLRNLTNDDMKKINSLFYTVFQSLNQEGRNSLKETNPFLPEKFTEEFFRKFQSKDEPNFKLDAKDLETLKIDFFKLAEILTSDDPIKKINETRKDLINDLQKNLTKNTKDQNNIQITKSIAEINNSSGKIREALEGMKKEVFEEAKKNKPEQSFENIRKRNEKDPFVDLSKEVLDYVDKKVKAGERKSFERDNTKINLESAKEARAETQKNK